MIINKGIDENPQNRFSTMQELISELAPFNTGLTKEELEPVFKLSKGEENKTPRVSESIFQKSNKNKKLKKEHKVLIVTILCICLFICLIIGHILLNCHNVYAHLENHEYVMAEKALKQIPFSSSLLPQESVFIKAGILMENKQYDKAIAELQNIIDYPGTKELIWEVKYRKAANLANQLEFDKAISIYKEIRGYKDSDDLIIDVTFRKASYLMKKEKFNESLSILNELSESGHNGTNEKIKEVYYAWGNYLMSKDNYFLAYEKFELANGYMNTPEILSELKEILYNEAVQLYREADYSKADNRFAAINPYCDSNIYLELIKIHQGEDSDINLNNLIGFEDVNELVMSSTYRASSFLQGTWRGDLYYFTMNVDGSIDYNIPWFNYGNNYIIEGGTLFLVNANSWDDFLTIKKETFI